MLTACGSGEDGAAGNAPGVETIPCAIAGAGAFANDCVVERARVDGALHLIVRHPDGGFRRFEVVQDGRGLVVADGAETAVARLNGEVLEVAVGADRYRFPSKVKADAETR